MRAAPGGFCWLDLAAGDVARARSFYEGAFGWSFREASAFGGAYLEWRIGGQRGTMYQLRESHLRAGVPSHWTPYVRVEEVGESLRRVASCGGRTVVGPLHIPGRARIALVQDAAGALLGLWEGNDTPCGVPPR